MNHPHHRHQRVGRGWGATIPTPPTPSMIHGWWVTQGGRYYSSGPPLSMGMGDLGLSNTSIHVFTDALQGVVAAGEEAALPSPYPYIPEGRVATLSLLRLLFACKVAGYRDLTPI